MRVAPLLPTIAASLLLTGCASTFQTQNRHLPPRGDVIQDAPAWPQIVPGEDLGLRNGRFADALGTAITIIEEGGCNYERVRAELAKEKAADNCGARQ